ncbi:hypothetical protein ACFYT3_22075 [Nocardia amikacinitolerans]|uniref:hypothetical protein n=1 Tax=Nocardia amikacinitolerans TaxID=756689 RepID=UPI0020A302E6|nr:hypothetical protein [Nocardia amikacinitolerans]MCP2287293.1 hypothetical protein [Nocardia amikacinitolerans]
MRRWLALLGVLLVCSVGCGERAVPELIPDLDALQFPEDDPQWETAAALRAVDVCALIPRPDLEQFGPVRVVGTNGIQACYARIATRTEGHVDLGWALVTSPPNEGGGGHDRRIGPARAWMVSDADNSTPEQIERSSYRYCALQVEPPPGGSVVLRVDSAKGIDACSVAERAAHIVLREWERHPRQGDSPDTVRTPLTGADPCAVLAELGIGRRGSWSGVVRCGFRYRGERIVVGYEYDTGRPPADYPPVPDPSGDGYRSNYPLVTVANRTGYRSESSGRHTYHLPLSSPVDLPSLADPRNPDQRWTPTVTIEGSDQEVVAAVGAAVSTLFD